MSENPFEIIPLNNDDAPEFWDITRLPEIKKDIAKATHSELNGENDINNLLQLFSFHQNHSLYHLLPRLETNLNSLFAKDI